MMTQPSGLKQNSLNFIQLKTDTQRNGYKTARLHRGPTSAAWRLPGRTGGPNGGGQGPVGPQTPSRQRQGRIPVAPTPACSRDTGPTGDLPACGQGRAGAQARVPQPLTRRVPGRVMLL